MLWFSIGFIAVTLILCVMILLYPKWHVSHEIKQAMKNIDEEYESLCDRYNEHGV